MINPYDASQSGAVTLRRRTSEGMNLYLVAKIVELEQRVRDLEKRLAEKEGDRG